jgi:hypothetical protein
MQKRDYGDIIGGVALIVGGTAFAIIGADYNIGTLRRMGPGYFPLSIGIILIAFGFLVALPALIRAGVTPKPEWRPLALIAGAIFVFALTVERLGLVPATMCLVAVAAVAERTPRLLGTLILAACLAAMAVGIFIKGLGMPIAAFKWGF